MIRRSASATSKKQQWVRIGEAARATGIPASTIRRWAKTGRIRCVQVGGRGTWRFVHLSSFAPPGKEGIVGAIP